MKNTNNYKILFRSLFMLMLIAAVTACSNKKDGDDSDLLLTGLLGFGGANHCVDTANGLCLESAGIISAEVCNTLQSSLSGSALTYGTGACTAVASVGQCKEVDFSGIKANIVYYSPTFDTTTAEAHCTTGFSASGGQFYPVP